MIQRGAAKPEVTPTEEATILLRVRTTPANARRLPSRLAVPDEFGKGVVSLLLDIADSEPGDDDALRWSESSRR